MNQTQKSPMHEYVPESRLSQAAFHHATEALPGPILNHSIRVFCYAKRLAAKEQSSHASKDVDVLFVACIFHDFGATETHNHSERFEVCGADAAVRFLKEYLQAEAEHKSGRNEAPPSQEPVSLDVGQVWDVWTAIALHTSPGIAERIHPLARLVRLAVKLDFGKFTDAKHDDVDFGAQLESDVPRLEIEKCLGDAVVDQAISKQEGDARKEKAPAASWPGILLRSHLEDPHWEGVNRAF